MNSNVRGFVIITTLLLAMLAGCLVSRFNGVTHPPPPPPITAPPPSATRVPIPITSTPTRSATLTPLPSPTATATHPAPTLTRTFTPNPSTLITPSPEALPKTGGDGDARSEIASLIGIGLIVASIGFVILRSRKHPSW